MGSLALNLLNELILQPKDDDWQPSTLYFTALGAVEYTKNMYPLVENDWSRKIIDEAYILAKMYRAEGDSLANDLVAYRSTRNGYFSPGETGIIIACFYVLAYDTLSDDDRKELLSIIETDGFTAHTLAGLVGDPSLPRPHDHDLADDPEAMLDIFTQDICRMRDAISRLKKNMKQMIDDKDALIKEMQVHSDDQDKTIAALVEEKKGLQKSLDKANNKVDQKQSLIDSKGERIKDLESMLKKAQDDATIQTRIAVNCMQRLKELEKGQNAPPAQPGIDAALTFDSILKYINEWELPLEEAKPIIQLLKQVMLENNHTNEHTRKLKAAEKRLNQRSQPSIHNQNSITSSNVNLGNVSNSQFLSSSSLPTPDSSLPLPDSSSEDSPESMPTAAL